LRKLVHLAGFIIKKFVTMHGHVIIKKTDMFCITPKWWCHFVPRTDAIITKMAAATQTCNMPFITTVGAAIPLNLQSGYPSLIRNPVMHHVTAES
jgi:hypothetical protein